jgi:hypothetical protein
MENLEQGRPTKGRRDFLKAAVAMGGAGLVVATTANEADAQGKTKAGRLERTLDQKAATLYSAAEAKGLTPTAAKMTIADIHEVQDHWHTSHKGGKTANAAFASYKTKSGLKVTIKDLQSLSNAHLARRDRQYGGKSWSVSCCSCSPCCTASAITKPGTSRTA